ARQSKSGFLDRSRASWRRRRMAQTSKQGSGKLVAALAQLDTRSIRREKAGPQQSRHRRRHPADRSSRPVRYGEIIEDRLTRGRRPDIAGWHSSWGQVTYTAPPFQWNWREYRAGRAVSRITRWPGGNH